MLFMSVNTSGADGTTSKALKPSTPYNNGFGGPDTNTFELLMLIHDRAYLNVNSEESIMCIMMKCNAVTTDSHEHSNERYVPCQ